MIHPNEKAPAANGGGRNYRPTDSTTFARSRASTICDWFNPRRRHFAEKLVWFLHWHGRRVFLHPEHYARLADDGMDAYIVDGALDDLHRLGCITIKMGGDVPVVELLDANIDKWARGEASP